MRRQKRQKNGRSIKEEKQRRIDSLKTTKELDLEIETNYILIAKDILGKHEAKTFEEALKIAKKEVKAEMYKMGCIDQDLDKQEQETRIKIIKGKRMKEEG